MKYTYRKKKNKFCYHVSTGTGTACRMENSTAFAKLDTLSDVPPPGRRLCMICADLCGLPSLPPPACAAIFTPPPAPPKRMPDPMVQLPPSGKPDPLLAAFGVQSSPSDADHIAVAIALAHQKFREKFGVACPPIDYGLARYALKRLHKGLKLRVQPFTSQKAVRRAVASKPAKGAALRPVRQDRVSRPKSAKLSPERAAYIISDAFLASFEWRQVRYEALKRSDGLCEACGRGRIHGEVLNGDHIKSRRLYPELALELSNVQILCGPCNHGKGFRDATDWREKNADKLATIDSGVLWERFDAF